MSTINAAMAISYPSTVHVPDFVVIDKTAPCIRAMRPDDVHFILEMHDRLSMDSLFYRYLHPYKPTFGEIDALHRMKNTEGEVFVVEIGEPEKRIVALAFYRIDAENPTIAQFAILVEDKYQGQGFGRALMQFMCDHAIANHVEFLDASVHPANRRCMRMIQQLGLPFKGNLSYGSLDVRIKLQPSMRVG